MVVDACRKIRQRISMQLFRCNLELVAARPPKWSSPVFEHP